MQRRCAKMKARTVFMRAGDKKMVNWDATSYSIHEFSTASMRATPKEADSKKSKAEFIQRARKRPFKLQKTSCTYSRFTPDALH